MEGKRRGGDSGVHGVVRDVKDQHRLADERGEDRQREQHVRYVCERGAVDDGSGPGSGHANTHGDYWEEKGGHDNETDDTNGPAEANMGKELSEQKRIDDAADRRPRSGNAEGETHVGGEPSRNQRHGGVEEKASTNTDADALGQHGLPVGCA